MTLSAKVQKFLEAHPDINPLSTQELLASPERRWIAVALGSLHLDDPDLYFFPRVTIDRGTLSSASSTGNYAIRLDDSGRIAKASGIYTQKSFGSVRDGNVLVYHVPIATYTIIVNTR